jgi:hypothetical protein
MAASLFQATCDNSDNSDNRAGAGLLLSLLSLLSQPERERAGGRT